MQYCSMIYLDSVLLWQMHIYIYIYTLQVLEHFFFIVALCMLLGLFLLFKLMHTFTHVCHYRWLCACARSSELQAHAHNRQ